MNMIEQLAMCKMQNQECRPKRSQVNQRAAQLERTRQRYLAVLKDEMTTRQVASRLGLLDCSAYLTLLQLVKRGLVKMRKEGKTIYWSVRDVA